MTSENAMTELTSEVILRTCTFRSDTPSSPHVFLESYAKAKNAVTSCVSDLRLSSKLLVVLSRTYTLYFTMLNVSELTFPEELPEIHEFVKKCINSSCRIAELHTLMLSKEMPDSGYVCERDLALSENESLVCMARNLRFSVLNSYGRIFAALPVLEIIYSCTELLKRAVDLCCALDGIGRIWSKDFML